jgi:hypothetical protein
MEDFVAIINVVFPPHLTLGKGVVIYLRLAYKSCV